MRPVLTLSVAVWLVAGLLGTTSYIWHYDVYRGFPPPKDPPGVSAGRVVHVNFFSSALHQRRYYLIYLPPGYARAAAHGERFPVLYLLHAPPGRPENYFLAGALAVKEDRLIDSGRTRPFLIALPNGRSGTYGNDTEWANTRAGAYESFVLDTVRAVDRRWATKPERAYRAIAGLSEGAYGATNVALHNPGLFATFESWSGYFEQTPTLPFTGASPAELRANSPSAYVPSIAPALRQLGMRAYLYQGETDPYPVAKLASFAGELRAAGVDVRVSLYPGKHNWRLWRMELPHMLEFAGRSFGVA
jgi:S-formylglutathione hydrolase FrmB